MQSTTFTRTTAKRGEAPTVTPVWFATSARNQVLGHLAVRVARIIQGKHKPSWTPNCNDGDYVVITDAEGIVLTGRKEQQKVYRYHTGFVGGLKEVPFLRMRKENPEKLIRLAIRRMLPKTALARQAMDKVKIYRGSEHPHVAQKPQTLPE